MFAEITKNVALDYPTLAWGLNATPRNLTDVRTNIMPSRKQILWSIGLVPLTLLIYLFRVSQ